MAKSAEIKARLTLNGAQFHAGLKSAKVAAHSFASSVGGGIKSAISSPITQIGGLLAGAFTAHAFAEGIKGALDLGGSLEDLKNRTGESADKLLYLQSVLKDNGVDGAMTGDILNKMQTTIAGAAGGVPKMTSALGAANLTFEDLIRLSPVQQFQKIGASITALDSPLQRIRAAREIFGKSGGSLLGALGDKEGFALAANALGRQAQLLDQNSATFDRISDRLGRASLKLQGFFVGAATTLAPALDAVTERLEKLDLAESGERFGKALKDAADYLAGTFAKPDEAFSAAGNYLKSMGAEVGNILVDAAVRFGETLWAGVELMFGKLMSAWKNFDGFVQSKLGLGDGGAAAKQEGANIGDQASAKFDQKMWDILNRKSKDYFGAGDFYNASKDAAKIVKQAGEEMLAGANEYSNSVEKAKGFTSTSSLNTGHGGLFTSGIKSDFEYLRSAGGNGNIHASSLFTTHGGTPLLSARERRKFENEAVASGEARQASSAGAYGAVRRGDAKRRKDFLKEQEKQKLGLDKTNELLAANVKHAKHLDETVSSWGPGNN